MQKGLSIITNFGCKTACEYCIWKTHSLYSSKSAYNISKLPSLLENDFAYVKKFSISGGGDPLFEVGKHWDFWREISKICEFYEKKVDIHTSMPMNMFGDQFSGYSEIFKNIVNRIVVHIPTTGPNTITSWYDYFTKNGALFHSGYKLRFNIVITSNISINMLKFFERKLIMYNANSQEAQIGYRELVGYENIKPSTELILFAHAVKNRIPFGRFVEQNDYNVYLFPNGEIKETFLQGEQNVKL